MCHARILQPSRYSSRGPNLGSWRCDTSETLALPWLIGRAEIVRPAKAIHTVALHTWGRTAEEGKQSTPKNKGVQGRLARICRVAWQKTALHGLARPSWRAHARPSLGVPCSILAMRECLTAAIRAGRREDPALRDHPRGAVLCSLWATLRYISLRCTVRAIQTQPPNAVTLDAENAELLTAVDFRSLRFFQMLHRHKWNAAQEFRS